MSMVAIIPARGNSKRLPRKNLLPINGVPLVVLAVRCAKDAGIFEEIAVTTEDEEIKRVVSEDGIATIFDRPPRLCDDRIQTATVVMDILGFWGYEVDSFCVLNPTSPLRTPDQLRELHRKFVSSPLDCLMTMGGGPGNYKHDGTALFCRTLPFLRTLDFYSLNAQRPIVEGSVDINTLEDYELAVRMDLARRHLESLSSR